MNKSSSDHNHENVRRNFASWRVSHLPPASAGHANKERRRLLRFARMFSFLNHGEAIWGDN
jgi:hypothetical protein